MNKSLHQLIIRIFLTGMFLLCLATAWAQTATFQNGVRKGMIKVKFSTAAAASISQAPVNARGNKLTTGIQSIDVTANAVKATGMQRIFPYDARFENKLRKHGLDLWYTVEISKDVDPKTAVAQFKQLKEVTYAEVEHEKIIAPYTVKPYSPGISTFAVPPFNDPLLKDQWHYNNTGQAGSGDADVNLFEAWKKTTGANNIIVSVHDEGVDVNHNDLKANIWVNQAELNGTANVDDDHNGYIDDINGFNFEKNKGALDAQYHGTHVSGTIAAVNNNGIGVSGVAGGNGSGNGVKIMSLQILGSNAAIEKSYVYAANNGAVISQNSWGYSSPGSFDQSVLDAIDYFVEEAGDYDGSPMKGGLVIFAAGNSDSNSTWYPGYYPSTMAVASLGPEWKRAPYSNYGPWVEIAAPGGDTQNYGSKGGVLSTFPKNQYGYLEGTSMACPHVSGIAALALANRTKQLTNTELWNKLVTGVISIDQYNEDYIGKLGTGAIDASLAIQNNQGKAPAQITTLAVPGIAQEFATLTWTVPPDEDDLQPVTFELYHHTQPITSANLATAIKTSIKNNKLAGQLFSYELTGLLGLTTYHFAITSTDRWGNISMLSSSISKKTNEGPSLAVDENSEEISIAIDVTSSFSGTHDLTIKNEAAGLLRWSHFMRHTSTSLAFNTAGLHYPVTTNLKSGNNNVLRRTSRFKESSLKLRSTEAVTSSFTAFEKTYAGWASDIIGETDLKLTNSAAAKFYVSEVDGFNLTNVQMYLNHDPELGPVIMEVYKGSSPIKKNLIYAQEYEHYEAGEATAFIQLTEQLYFETGSTFWIVFHVPAGNLYPFGIGFEEDPSYSDNCFMSFNMGSTWTPLEDLIYNENFAWTISAVSNNQHLGTYLILEPGSGDLDGDSEIATTLTANATTLINGDYHANLVITSNDAQTPELRIPVNVTVSGQKPNIKFSPIADYGSVFVGTEKTIELVLENNGYGNYNDPLFSIDNPAFSIVDGAPWKLYAREESTIKIKFSPLSTGNSNGTLTFTNGDQSYQIALFGVGTESSKINVSPTTQVINNVTIGDVVNAQITVENTGAYPLQYFIPGHDTKGISVNWPSDYHTYGYKFRNSTDNDPIAYEFQDISATGLNITEKLTDASYYQLDMGFEFPYYGENMKTLYIAQKGYTTFDNSINPVNTPNLPGNQYSPKGIISILGSHFNYTSQGEIFYQVEADRIIVQYNNVWDGANPESITAQMVLFANGDIRFYYDKMEYSEFNQLYLAIMIEDLEHRDGILVHDYDHPIALSSGLALGFDYPGPAIISSIENGSGIITPGSSVVVDVELSTASLVEGTTNRYINFISNDPFSAQTAALIQLEVTDGGTPEPVFSTEEIAFGNVFQGAIRSIPFTIKNPGSANVDITSITLANGAFVLHGDVPTVIKPGLYKIYEVEIPTNVLASLEDELTIHFADGSEHVIPVSGNVVEAPAINVDLSTLQHTQAFGEKSTHPFSIENTGQANLEVATVGTQWLSFTTATTPSDFTYAVEKHNDGNFYQWIDIHETGTHLPFWDLKEDTYWQKLELPFPIEYYGETYSSLKIGDNGIISFEAEPTATIATDNIPTDMHDGPCIMPYWTFGGFNTMFYPEDEVGIFYKFYDDKFIITWSYFINRFGGMGDPVSAQMIFYKNGSMKFQYKVEETGSDLTSRYTAIGLQKNSSIGISISDFLELDHGSGLAFMISPVKKYSVSPGSALNGEIVLDATNIYGGQYNGALKIHNNAPNNELLEKPIELTVTGDALASMADDVDFGNKMVLLDQWGTPLSNFVDFSISNTGAGPLTIDWAQMADGTQGGLSLQVWGLFPPMMGWGDPEMRWGDIAELFSPWASPTTLTIIPNDRIKARAVFAPASAGDFTDEIVFTTNIGEIRVTLTGSAIEPPALNVTTTGIHEVMNTLTEKVNRSITFDNEDGASDLTYNVSIDFGRVEASSRSVEKMSASGTQLEMLRSTKASVADNHEGAKALVTYNRTLNHTQNNTPDTFVGIGSAGTFRVATKYNAGVQGFNLSHVETWFRRETLTSGTILAEIRAGGKSIAEATLIAQGSLQISGTGTDNAGSWYSIKLDKPTGIYPNEDFYVVITYPLGIDFPQGTIDTGETTDERYYYFDFDKAEWNDIQKVSKFETLGWLMYAGEETAGNSTWLTITSPLSGTVSMGGASSIGLSIEGAFAQRGDQVANIVLTSNDPKKDTVLIPVTLHMNEAPLFSKVPESILAEEGKTLAVNLTVADPENHTYTVASKQAYPWLTYTFANGAFVLTLKPNFGDAGNYNIAFTATDQHNAVRELTIPVEIAHTNRAPKFIGESETMSFNATGLLNQFAIEDFFSDPDGDEFTFTLTNSNTSSVVVFAAETEFLIRPIAVGQAKLMFTVTDSHGAVTKDTLVVNVDVVLAAEEELKNNGLGVYPNAAVDIATVTISNDWTGEVDLTLIDVTGKQYLTQHINTATAREATVDVSSLAKGIYILKAASGSRQASIKLIKK